MRSDLMNIQEVAEYFGISESTIRRRLRDRKNGEGSFLVPIFGLPPIHGGFSAFWSIVAVERPEMRQSEIAGRKAVIRPCSTTRPV